MVAEKTQSVTKVKTKRRPLNKKPCHICKRDCCYNIVYHEMWERAAYQCVKCGTFISSVVRLSVIPNAIKVDKNKTYFFVYDVSPEWIVTLRHKNHEELGSVFLNIDNLGKGNTGSIYNFEVEESFRNQGLGSMILAELIKTARKKGLVKLRLGATENAVRLYQRFGFVVTKAGRSPCMELAL